MSQYSASPREGHMEALYYIFAYLTLFPCSKLAFDLSTPMINESCFQHDVDWKLEAILRGREGRMSSGSPNTTWTSNQYYMLR
jgi:hypothetical protein